MINIPYYDTDKNELVATSVLQEDDIESLENRITTLESLSSSNSVSSSDLGFAYINLYNSSSTVTIKSSYHVNSENYSDTFTRYSSSSDAVIDLYTSDCLISHFYCFGYLYVYGCSRTFNVNYYNNLGYDVAYIMKGNSNSGSSSSLTTDVLGDTSNTTCDIISSGSSISLASFSRTSSSGSSYLFFYAYYEFIY